MKLVSRAMPVSVIRPLADTDAGLAADHDPLSAATTAGASWGIGEALGKRPRDLTGKGVKVAVLDTGIDARHPAFTGMNLSPRNFVGGEGYYADVHGTYCAGTIFGRNASMNGTSMACSHVAGVAALWWQWIALRNAGLVKASDVRA